jgi:hypothetical protein
LAFNVGTRGPTLIQRTKGEPIRVLRFLGSGEEAPPWERAKELLPGGVERDRKFNAAVLEKHLIGDYAVAPASAGWVQWACLDIDAHRRAGETELDARRRAKRVLGGVWRALGCSATRHPLLLRSPGGGYHLWLPLTREATSTNPEHTWPAKVVRAWVVRHMEEAGLELASGVLEVFPSGRCLRAPCGRGMVLLLATQPDNPDGLGLVPWPGTAEVRIDWRGELDELTSWSRHVVPTVRAFVEQWGAQRRTLAEWLQRPAAAWDPQWGFLGWRGGEAIPAWEEIPSDEKNWGTATGRQQSRSQQSDDDLPCAPAGGSRVGQEGEGGVERFREGKRESRKSKGSGSPDPKDQLSPSAPDVGLSPGSSGGPLVHGRAFFEKVQGYLQHGVTEPFTRYDAVLVLSFYWAATCGLQTEESLARMEAWCTAHPHQGSKLCHRPRAFLNACLREARHYIEHKGRRWRFKGKGHAGGLATLKPADRNVIGAVDARVANEVAVILSWLAGRAGSDGRIADAVQLSHGLLKRLCGERRVDVEGDGARRRAVTVALTELERIGVLTMASNYRVGQRGRTWACWYQFGSGALPRAVALPVAKWDEIEPFTARRLVPSLAVLEVVESAPQEAPPVVEVRVLGERVVPEGLLRVLSHGARGPARTLLTLAPGVAAARASGAKELWFEGSYRLRPFTPGRLWGSDPAKVMAAFPDIEARRKMTRKERCAWGGGGAIEPPSEDGAAVVPHRPARSEEVSAPSASLAASDASSVLAAVAPGAAEPIAAPVSPDAPARPNVEVLRAELAAEVGDAAAAAVPPDMLEAACRAWAGFRGRGRGS